MSVQIINKYFPNLSEEQKSQFQQLENLYKDWNEKINVISRKDIDNLYLRHVLHSLAIAKFINFTPGTRVVDVGTGGGFPGVPLAILFPEVEFILVDSIRKKIIVADAISSSLKLNNVKSVNDRIENLPGTYDFFVSRAVTKLDIAWGWVGNKISPNNVNSIKNGLIYLKGGDINDEIPNKTIVQQLPLSRWFDESFFEDKGIVYITKQ